MQEYGLRRQHLYSSIPGLALTSHVFSVWGWEEAWKIEGTLRKLETFNILRLGLKL